MMLLNLIRKSAPQKVATAISAIPATAVSRSGNGIARIATVAVANPVGMTAAPPRGIADHTAPSQVVQAVPMDRTPKIDACAERMSFALRIATEECGATLDEVTERQIAYWRHRIEVLREPSNPRLTCIKTACLTALAQRWAFDAARIGWSDCDMFGLDPVAPTIRSGIGLVPSLVLSAHRRPIRIVAINPSEAVIETGSGLRWCHYKCGRAGPPLWEHPAFQWLH